MLYFCFKYLVRNYKISRKMAQKCCIKFVKWWKYRYFNKKSQGKYGYFRNNSVNLPSVNKRLIKKILSMKSLGYLSAFLGGAIAGAALGILMAPEKGQDTRVKITDAVEDFLKKHNIKLSRKEVVDLVDDIQDAAEEE